MAFRFCLPNTIPSFSFGNFFAFQIHSNCSLPRHRLNFLRNQSVLVFQLFFKASSNFRRKCSSASCSDRESTSVFCRWLMSSSDRSSGMPADNIMTSKLMNRGPLWRRIKNARSQSRLNLRNDTREDQCLFVFYFTSTFLSVHLQGQATQQVMFAVWPGLKDGASNQVIKQNTCTRAHVSGTNSTTTLQGYSQLRLRRTRSGPAPTVRLREVSALEGDEVNNWSTTGTNCTCPL